jgi:mRNA-degrading endonuclease RelE of RelBE toxin-antitoxin system
MTAFLIADTFTDSLARLTGDEQKAVKTTAFDLQVNPAHPSHQFHKLDRAKDKRFWSVRAGTDIRLIVHKGEGTLLLCYVGHHNDAYGWAERRKLETHPATGAAQFVEIRETVKEVIVPVFVAGEPEPAVAPAPVVERALFAHIPEATLLGYGIPPEWLADVQVVTDSSLLALADHLPAEAAEALLELATGGTPRAAVHTAVPELAVVTKNEEPAAPAPAPVVPDPFAHPDAQRRFRVMSNAEELAQALDAPWDKWTVFLHPAQRQLVERTYGGPAKVAGSAGTGKTIVALHRAAHLARSDQDARVLLTTFSDTLAHELQTRLKRLLAHEPRLGERIDVVSLPAIGLRLHRAHIGPVKVVTPDALREVIHAAAPAGGAHKFSDHFLLTEWEHVVDAWQLDSWEAYRDVARLGRKTRLPEAQRAMLWRIFEEVRRRLAEQGLKTWAQVFNDLARELARKGTVVFTHAVVDEAQDLSVAQLRLLAALGGNRPDALFFAGDLGQRIFQQPFSWKSLGVDVRGRSRTLHVNYRTSHQIRMQADRLLGPAVVDVDGNSEERAHTVSVFNGPLPALRGFPDEATESAAVGAWLAQQTKSGLAPHELAIFVRSDAQIDRARQAVEASGLPFRVLDEHVQTVSGKVAICTMHLAKGLEFRAVAVMACDDEVLPLQARIEAVGDDADLQEIYDTERHLLYVACTRARENLLVSGVQPMSEFVDDLAL